MSRSTIVMSSIPVRTCAQPGVAVGWQGACSEGVRGCHTKFLTSSQPMPPAPTTNTLTLVRSVPVSSLVRATLAEGSSRARFSDAMRLGRVHAAKARVGREAKGADGLEAAYQ